MELPKTLKPYTFHGIYFDFNKSDKNAIATCPFCEKEGKLSVRIEDGLWRCLFCSNEEGKGQGNTLTFLRDLWNESHKLTEFEDLAELAEEKKIETENLYHWGFCKSVINGSILSPAYNVKGDVIQIYRYAEIKGKKKLLATPNHGQGIFGLHTYNIKKHYEIFICEGAFDALRLWQALKNHKTNNDDLQHTEGIVATKNQKNSFLKDVAVIGIPGCHSFADYWADLFPDKIVNLLFDNDHPSKHPKTGNTIEPSGFSGVKRTAKILSSSATSPLEINYLNWGSADKGYNESIPNGFDVSDLFNKGLINASK